VICGCVGSKELCVGFDWCCCTILVTRVNWFLEKMFRFGNFDPNLWLFVFFLLFLIAGFSCPFKVFTFSENGIPNQGT